jgi:hypothetical protein
MKGWGWQSVHDPDELPRVVESWQQAIATGAPFELEFPLRRRDGVFRWFLTRATPVRDGGGALVLWVGVTTDVDDHRRDMRALAELRAASERSVRAREVLLAIVSHDLGNPLGTVLLAAQLIERAADGSAAGLRTKKASLAIRRAADQPSWRSPSRGASSTRPWSGSSAAVKRFPATEGADAGRVLPDGSAGIPAAQRGAFYAGRMPKVLILDDDPHRRHQGAPRTGGGTRRDDATRT